MNFTLKRIEGLIEQALKEEPTGDQWLDVRYDEQKPLIGHLNPYYRLFYLLSQELKPKFVVILGGWQGTCAAHFAAPMPEATVVTIDHHSDPGDELNRHKILDVTYRYPNVKYLRGWTTPGYDEKYEKIASDNFRPKSVLEDVKTILGKDKIDILFIDSWHEGRYFKRDWDYYSPLLANPALVICDDVFNSDHFIDMVETFDTLPGEKFLNKPIHAGVPMGFVKYEIKTTTTRRPRKKRTTTRKTA